MTKNSRPEGRNTGSGAPSDRTTAEAKRLAARRRFLLGGASALPLIVTLGQKEAWAASAALCQSLGISYDEKYATQGGGFVSSMYCDPTQRWS